MTHLRTARRVIEFLTFLLQQNLMPPHGHFLSAEVKIDWIFRIMMIVMTVGFAALVSLGLSAIIFDRLAGMGFIRLPIAALPILIGLYASITVILSCLFED